MVHVEPTLRQRLEETTEALNNSQYLAIVTAVIRDFPNTVTLLDSPHPIESYTCVMRVFDFTGKPAYADIAQRGFSVALAGPTFIQWLLGKEILTAVNERNPQEGDLVIYFNEENRVRHVGLVRQQGRVESKWGLGGLFEHGLFEVPASYGNEAKFFKRLSFEDAIAHLKSFARERGVIFLD